MALLLTDTLFQYLRGDEWQHTIKTFVRSHCDEFKGVEASGYSHHHHKIWKDFKDMSENVLGFALDTVGGSIESLEKVPQKFLSYILLIGSFSR